MRSIRNRPDHPTSNRTVVPGQARSKQTIPSPMESRLRIRNHPTRVWQGKKRRPIFLAKAVRWHGTPIASSVLRRLLGRILYPPLSSMPRPKPQTSTLLSTPTSFTFPSQPHTTRTCTAPWKTQYRRPSQLPGSQRRRYQGRCRCHRSCGCE